MPFIVMERGFEYNDEIYETPEDDDVGRAVRIYDDKTDADKRCLRENIDWVKGNSLGNYYYGEDEFFLDPELVLIITKNKDFEYPMQVPTDLEHADYKKLVECIYPHSRAYFVVEVPE